MIELVGVFLWLLLWAIGIGAAFIGVVLAIEMARYIWDYFR